MAAQACIQGAQCAFSQYARSACPFLIFPFGLTSASREMSRTGTWLFCRWRVLFFLGQWQRKMKTMIINCESCHAALEVPDSLADGQPVRCPYCQCRFIYVSRGRKETEGGDETRQSSAEQTPIDGSAELWTFVLRCCRHILNSWVSAWKSMFDFGGRMPRREYLEFIVFQLLGMVLLFHFIGKNSVVRDNLVSALLPPVRWIMLFTLISATVRRLHDMNRSGKWLLLLLIPIAFDPVRNWLPWIAFGVVVGVGLIRTRGEGNTYSPLQSNRWPLVALILILALGALIQFLTSMVNESVRSERKCDAQMTDVKNVIIAPAMNYCESAA